MENLFGLSLLSQFLVTISFMLIAFIFWIYRRQSYFENHYIPYVNSIPLLGSLTDSLFGKVSFYDDILGVCNQPKVKGKPFFGIFLFHMPTVMVNEPEIIKRILVKDFQSFSNRYTTTDIHDYLGYNQLFSLKNSLWKKMRGKLSPFSAVES
ncbi:CLUMA_CG011463, isoform A [Clunio marinus]|uniref:CLUMA_CG011463, isoform A n=1 Tax=Clunio marinus TaxID=568069 RepID=A0A1J1ICT6_9DIPT|nr:CLUMA_CG011463, isoform A [Clunio marinus]